MITVVLTITATIEEGSYHTDLWLKEVSRQDKKLILRACNLLVSSPNSQTKIERLEEAN